MYDYVIVGAGLFGACFACEAAKHHKRSLIVEKRDHVGGNVFTKEIEGIHVHVYGAHIFHTSNQDVWNYVNQYAEFNRFTNSPMAIYHGEIYNLPFNMNTFSRMWGITTPAEAEAIISRQRTAAEHPQNLREQAVSLVGTDIYEKLIEGYTEKQWGKPCTELPAFIIQRLPVRFTYDNNYFNDRYQGIPIQGYTRLIENMLDSPLIHVQFNTDYFDRRAELESQARKVVYTGMIDEFYGCRFGALEYRSLRFETEVLEMENYQGNAVINYTDNETPYTRIIEHKHFHPAGQPKTVITKEYPSSWERGKEPYYPINDASNNALYQRYKELSDAESNYIFGGRLANYRYYDMDDVLESALARAAKEFD